VGTPWWGPLLLLTAWVNDTTVVGVAPDGVLFISRDPGRGWAPAGGSVPGVPRALAAGLSRGQREIVLVTDDAIWRSVDDGASLIAYRGGPM